VSLLQARIDRVNRALLSTIAIVGIVASMQTPFAGVIALGLLIGAAPVAAQQAPSGLPGLWYAKLRFGPDVRGRLVIDRASGAWRASVAGRSAPVRVAADSFSFELPGDGGRFVGRSRRAAAPAGATLAGRWIQGRTSMPLTLESCGAECYQGVVTPLDDTFTFWLDVRSAANGSLGALLRNPERNQGGQWIPVASIRADSNSVAFLDRNGRVLSSGPFRNGTMSVPLRGGTYDFRRLPDSAYTDYFPRGRPSVKYVYTPPRQERDGWQVGRLRDVGIAEDSITAFVQALIDLPIDSVSTPQTHALLIARHGRLVLEEYFHGEHADKPHDTRSASKSHVTALIGAAMHAGVRIGPESRVYATLRPTLRELPERKRAVTLDHLLTMSGGFDCNDSGERPGDEDAITNQDTNPDWSSLFLGVDMVRDPGAAAQYCSMEPYLAGLMLERVSGRPLPDLFHELLAEPLGFQRYTLGLTPLGEAYFGGGHRFVARDFLKLPQMYLNGGTWNGRRILTEEWVKRSTTERYRMGSRGYGYLWWIIDYPYQGRTIRAYAQLGNGSQNAVFVPELDLAFATFGANYNSRSINHLLNALVPRHILPAVDTRR
jgi:CubicO group peptidase (beta-lactamase class C family)